VGLGPRPKKPSIVLDIKNAHTNRGRDSSFWVGLDGLLNARDHSQDETDAERQENVRIEIKNVPDR